MSALEDVLARLDGVRQSGDGYVARCPVHEDRHASLSVAGGQDRAVVFNCHACRAASDDIVVALGLEPRDILGARKNGEVVPFRNGRTEARRPSIVARTTYDVQGYQHVRLTYQDGSKSFVWQHDGRNGLPEGVRGEDLLYGAESLAEVPDGTTVALCEGEQAADAVRACMIAAVATVTGAAGTPSETALGQLLRFDLVLWADNDQPGQGHMQRTAERLVALGRTPRWIVWGDAPPKGDAADASPDERSRLVDDAVPYTPELVSAGTSISIEPAETISLFVTARQIAETTAAEPEWIARPYVARGAITEVAGKLKASDKTTWLLALCRKVLDGTLFMGSPTAKTGVIYLTEQAGTSFRAGLARANLLERDDMAVLFWHRARGLEWSAIVQAAVAEAKRLGYGLIVVDTLPQFSGVTGDNENSAGAALDAMKPLQEAAAEDLAILVSRHERKGGGEVGESGRGSSAYSGAVDIVLSIRRAEGQSKETIRVIHALGRFDDTPAELVVDLVHGEYVALGTAQAVKAQEATALLLGELPIVEDDAKTITEIVDLLKESKVKRTTVLQILADLEAAGTIQHVGKGKRGDPYRYWRSPETHSAGTPVAPTESIHGGAETVDEEV